jgi:DNA-binding transcriptional LysR family regulator
LAQPGIAFVQIESWDDLRYLLAIGREGSLNGAARRLGVNHSTVFRRLNGSEARLGVRLFERHTDGYAPTAAGEEVLRHAQRIEESIDAIGRSAAGRDVQLSGSIRLTTAANLAVDYVAGYLPQWLERYPEIRIEIAVGDRDFDLARREADVALRATTLPPEYLVGRKVRDIQWWVFGGERYLARQPRPQAMGDLAAHALIGAEASFLRLPVFGWLQARHGDAPVVARANDLNTMAALAQAGVGLALLPSDQVRPGLERLFPVEPAFPAALWLLTHPDLRRVVRIRVFIEYLSERLRADPRLD